MTWTKEREDEIRSRWAGHSSDVDAVFSWFDAEREARQRAEALLATIDKHTAHNDPMQVTASALARSIQRAERERDEARAAADEWERRETQALVDLGRAEAQRDEARAERDAIAARYDALREAAGERFAEHLANGTPGTWQPAVNGVHEATLREGSIVGPVIFTHARRDEGWFGRSISDTRIVAAGVRVLRALADPDGAARERAERQAERERLRPHVDVDILRPCRSVEPQPSSSATSRAMG